MESLVDVPGYCPGCGIRVQIEQANRPGYLKIPKSFTQPQDDEQSERVLLVCERCYSLRHYGKLKSEEAEKLVPKFHVENKLKPKLAKSKGKKVVIVCVVDLFDFEASLPATVIKDLFPRSVPDFLELIIVGNKLDLIPKGIKKETLQIWVRTRLKEYRLPYAESVHLISSHTMQGVFELMKGLKNRIVRNTDCYIVGMQNAGKSSMMNALGKLVKNGIGGQKQEDVTAAFLPGTTLGFIKVSGFPVAKSCQVYDTPGLIQNLQVTSRLTAEELKLVQPKKALMPRTYRFGVNQSLLIGGLARIDLVACPGPSLYMTIWVADQLTCYLGKTENVEEKLQKHGGHKLAPPLYSASEERSPLVDLIPQDLKILGDSWKGASVDICIGGLGWVAVGCQGQAEVKVWTWDGIQVKQRPALIKKVAPVFQKPGFSVAVS